MSTCDRPMRDGPCQMPVNHRGRHSTVVFYCDLCGKTRRGRGTPLMFGEGPAFAVVQRISYDETEHVADGCFMCLRVDTDVR